jgi:hypothetical protein
MTLSPKDAARIVQARRRGLTQDAEHAHSEFDRRNRWQELDPAVRQRVATEVRSHLHKQGMSDADIDEAYAGYGPNAHRFSVEGQEELMRIAASRIKAKP